MGVDMFDGSDQLSTKRETPLLTIRYLLNELAHGSKVRRELARCELVSIGGPVVIRALVCELGNCADEARWEAAKALDEIEGIETKGA